MIKIWNKRTVPKGLLNPIYIGRPSVLGNPFPVAVHGHGVCIDMFKKYLWNAMQANTEQNLEIQRLAALYKETGELNLVCWCKPRACHGDVIENAIKYILSKEQ